MGRILVPAHHVSYPRWSPYHRGANAYMNSTMKSSGLDPAASANHVSLAKTASRGKYYCEFKPTTIAGGKVVAVGITDGSASYTTSLYSHASSYVYCSDGYRGSNGSLTAYGATWAANDVIGMALDLDAQTLTFYKNGTSQGATGYTPAQAVWLAAWTTVGTNSSNAQHCEIRIDPRDWTQTPPSGHGAFGTIIVPPPICEWNPADKNSSLALDYDNRHGTTGTGGGCRATRKVSTGKWYWEVVCEAVDSYTPMIGMGNASYAVASGYPGYDTNSLGYYGLTGSYYKGAGGVAYGATYTKHDVIGVALDMDAGTCTFYKNNVSQGAITHGITGPFFPAFGNPGAGTQGVYANFHKSSLIFAPPSGFSAIGGG